MPIPRQIRNVFDTCVQMVFGLMAAPIFITFNIGLFVEVVGAMYMNRVGLTITAVPVTVWGMGIITSMVMYLWFMTRLGRKLLSKKDQ